MGWGWGRRWGRAEGCRGRAQPPLDTAVCLERVECCLPPFMLPCDSFVSVPTPIPSPFPHIPHPTVLLRRRRAAGPRRGLALPRLRAAGGGAPAAAVLRVPRDGRCAQALHHQGRVVPLGLPAVDPRGGLVGLVWGPDDGVHVAWRALTPVVEQLSVNTPSSWRLDGDAVTCHPSSVCEPSSQLPSPAMLLREPPPLPLPLAAVGVQRACSGACGGRAVGAPRALGPAVLRVPPAHGRQGPVRHLLHSLPPALCPYGRWVGDLPPFHQVAGPRGRQCIRAAPQAAAAGARLGVITVALPASA